MKPEILARNLAIIGSVAVVLFILYYARGGSPKPPVKEATPSATLVATPSATLAPTQPVRFLPFQISSGSTQSQPPPAQSQPAQSTTTNNTTIENHPAQNPTPQPTPNPPQQPTPTPCINIIGLICL